MVFAFAAIWLLCALVPLVLSAILSILGAHGLHIRWSITFNAYRDLLDSGRWEVILQTMRVAATVSLICLLSGFPFAFWLAKRVRSKRLIQIIWMGLTVPFFLDPSARTIVWRTVLGSTGLINTALLRLHWVNTPVEWLLFSDFSVYLGLVAQYYPNMVMPIYLAILLIDDELLHASADLGAAPGATLRHIVIPLAMPGIVAGVIFTLVPVMGDSGVPAVRGGSNREYLADAVMSLSTSMNYSGAAALATIILTLTAILLPLFGLARSRTGATATRGQAA